MADENVLGDAASGAANGAAAGSIVPGVGTAIGAIGGGLAGIASGIISQIISGPQRQQAYNAINQANNIIQQLGLPASQATPIILDQLRQAGIADPQVLQNVANATNAYANIAPDTSNIQAQQQALQALQQRGNVGLNAEDRASLQQIRNQVGADAEGRRQQILQNMQAMGQGGGGAALAAQLQASQGEANTESQQANAQAATAAQRALQALQASGSLAGDIRNQNYGIASNQAAAQNEMNRFNISNQYNTGVLNNQQQNAAQLYNAQNQQAISNQNVANQNAELLRQKLGQQQDFANQTGLAQLKAGALGNVANMYAGQAANTGQIASGIGSGVGGILGGVGQYINGVNALTAGSSVPLASSGGQVSITPAQIQAFINQYGSGALNSSANPQNTPSQTPEQLANMFNNQGNS